MQHRQSSAEVVMPLKNKSSTSVPKSGAEERFGLLPRQTTLQYVPSTARDNRSHSFLIQRAATYSGADTVLRDSSSYRSSAPVSLKQVSESLSALYSSLQRVFPTLLELYQMYKSLAQSLDTYASSLEHADVSATLWSLSTFSTEVDSALGSETEQYRSFFNEKVLRPIAHLHAAVTRRAKEAGALGKPSASFTGAHPATATEDLLPASECLWGILRSFSVFLCAVLGDVATMWETVAHRAGDAVVWTSGAGGEHPLGSTGRTHSRTASLGGATPTQSRKASTIFATYPPLASQSQGGQYSREVVSGCFSTLLRQEFVHNVVHCFACLRDTVRPMRVFAEGVSRGVSPEHGAAAVPRDPKPAVAAGAGGVALGEPYADVLQCVDRVCRHFLESVSAVRRSTYEAKVKDLACDPMLAVMTRRPNVVGLALRKVGVGKTTPGSECAGSALNEAWAQMASINKEYYKYILDTVVKYTDIKTD